MATVAVVAASSAACGGESSVAPSTGSRGGAAALTVESPQIPASTIARAQSCDGGNHVPEIRWRPLPAGARSVLVEMLDPDAPGGTFTHWLAYRDAAASSTAGGGWTAGANDFGSNGYRGPCPPAGQTHRYHIEVDVLSSPLGSGAQALHAGFHRGDADLAVASRIVLAQGELVASYGR